MVLKTLVSICIGFLILIFLAKGKKVQPTFALANASFSSENSANADSFNTNNGSQSPSKNRIDFFREFETHELRKIMLSYACGVLKIPQSDFQVVVHAYLEKVEDFLPGLDILAGILFVLTKEDDRIFIKDTLTVFFATKKQDDIQTSILYMLNDIVVYQPNFADKNLVSFFIQAVYLWLYKKQMPTKHCSKLLKEVLKTKSFKPLKDAFFSDPKNGITTFVLLTLTNLTVGFLLFASPSEASPAYIPPLAMMKTGVQSKKPPRQLTTCTSALMRPEQLNATNKVFVVKKTVVRSYTIGTDLNGKCVISESPEVVTQKTTIKDLYATFSSDSTYSNPLESSFVILDVTNNDKITAYNLELLNQQSKASDKYLTNLKNLLHTKQVQKDLKLNQKQVDNLVFAEKTEKAHVWPLKMGAFTLERTGGQDYSSTLNLDAKLHDRLDADRIWSFKAQEELVTSGKKNLFDVLLEKKAAAVNTILEYQGAFAYQDMPPAARKLYLAAAAARYEFLFNLEFEDLTKSFTFVTQSNLIDFFNLELAISDLEKKVDKQLEACNQFLNTQKTVENSNKFAVLIPIRDLNDIRESFIETSALSSYIKDYITVLSQVVSPDSTFLKMHQKERLQIQYDTLILRTKTSLQKLYQQILTFEDKLDKQKLDKLVFENNFALVLTDYKTFLKNSSKMNSDDIFQQNKSFSSPLEAVSNSALEVYRKKAILSFGYNSFKKNAPSLTYREFIRQEAQSQALEPYSIFDLRQKRRTQTESDISSNKAEVASDGFPQGRRIRATTIDSKALAEQKLFLTHVEDTLGKQESRLLTDYHLSQNAGNTFSEYQAQQTRSAPRRNVPLALPAPKEEITLQNARTEAKKRQKDREKNASKLQTKPQESEKSNK